MADNNHNKIDKREITTELQESYLDYAMSVIVSRALPDVRDGLKPVQRRILWGMWDAGVTADAKFRKSADVVGEVMGKYHPHGDSSIYQTIVRMVQDFSFRYPLCIGQGNWGSVDGDEAAAMRYCVTGDTLIPTHAGLMPINKLSVGIEDINITILSKEKKINRASKWFDSGIHPTLKITTNRGYSVTGSHNHPILIWNTDTQGEPRLQWKKLEALEVGDIAVLDRSNDVLWPSTELDVTPYHPKTITPRTEIKSLPNTLTKELAFILGALVSEGAVSKTKIEFCNSDEVFINAFKMHWQNVFPDGRLHEFHKQPSSYGKKPYTRLEIHAKYIREFLYNLGLAPVTAHYKTIPTTILQSPKTVVAAFLQSYFEGDGTITTSGRMIELGCCSASEKLIEQLQIVLLRFGIATFKRWDAYRTIFKLYVRGLNNYEQFASTIGFVSNRKNNRLAAVIEKSTKDNSQTDYIPHLAAFVRQLTVPGSSDRQFVLKNNFDRFATLAQHAGAVAAALPMTIRQPVEKIFEQLLHDHPLFDPIVKIEKAGLQQVFSLRVESACHSFVGNGFINHNTETKLSRVSEGLLTDIEKETVDWVPNYSGTKQEPKFLPAKLPQLLLNGTVGIAVGMATNIPPHNLGEVIDATLHLSDHPKATTEDLLEFIKGPDFPTGGIIYNKKDIAEAYSTGKGAITMRGVAEIKERKGQKGFNIEITEIPYQVNKSELIIKMAELVQEKRLDGVRDIRDESDKNGMSIVLELKNDSAPQKTLNQLFNHTDLQKNFNVNMVALTKNGLQPEVMSLKDILEEFIDHRKLVVERRAQYDLKKAKEREHILLGLSKALSVIDKIIATIKKSANRDDAQKNLIKNFKLTIIQANAILEMKLSTLAALERKKIEDELAEKKKLIAELESLIKSPAKILKVIKDELIDLQKKYGDERRTKVVSGGLKEFADEDLIPQEDAIITLSAGGYIKRLPPGSFKPQHRGGKGLIGSDVADEDFLAQLVFAKTHDNILFFTDRGRVFQTKVYEIPAASRQAKGKPVHNFLDMPTEEHISAIVTFPQTYADQTRTSPKNSAGSASSLPAGQAGPRESAYLAMATVKGMIKKTPLKDFDNVRRNGIIAMGLKKGDALKWVSLTKGNDEIIITTAQGQAIHFKESQVRAMGRTAAGVRGIKLKGADYVSSMNVVSHEMVSAKGGSASGGKNYKLLVVMSNGFGKQTPLTQYKVQGRGGSGIKTAKVTPKTGIVMDARVVSEEKELLALSAKGQVIRTQIEQIRTASRATQGVRIMHVADKDKLIGIICF